MEKRQQHFLNLLNNALTGAPVCGMDDLSDGDWQEIISLAGIHKVLPLVYQAAYGLPAARPALTPLRGQVRRQVMLQTQKTHTFLELNRRLREAGIRAMVVKGIVCRSLYPNGDLRPSADEDILVSREQFDAARAVLEEMGFTTTETGEDAYELPYRMPGDPAYIELHRDLFPPQSEAYGAWNGFFEDAFQRAVTIPVQGEAVLTMEPTDHLLYLILHAFKHFLHSGVGVRQVCDIAVCANVWGARVDWDRLYRCCGEVNGTLFAGTLLRIGGKHLGLDEEKACIPECWRDITVDEGPMLEDILAGGVYGDSSLSRLHSSSMTLDAVAAESRDARTGSAVLRSVFPAPKKLEGKYRYLKKHPYLVPVAWVDRLLRYTRELRQTPGSGAAEAVAIGSRRLELLRQYGVIR